jgi:hypothetical protein
MKIETAIGILSAWRERDRTRRLWSLCLGSVCDLFNEPDPPKRFPAESDEAAIISAALWLTAQDPSLGKAELDTATGQLHIAARTLMCAWEATAKQHLEWAHAPQGNGLSVQARAIFAGRSDGYQNCADTLGLVLKLFEIGMDISEIHLGVSPPKEEER